MSERKNISNDDISAIAKQIEQLPGELKTNLLNQYGITNSDIASAVSIFDKKFIQNKNYVGNCRQTFYALDDKGKAEYMLGCCVIKSRNHKGASTVKDYFNGNASALELIRALRSRVHFVPSADDGKDPAEEKVTPPSASVKPVAPAPVEPAVPASLPVDDELEGVTVLSQIGVNGFWDYNTAKAVKEEEPEPWLIESLIRKGTANLLVAQANSGKTNFVMDMLTAVASGAPFLPKPDGTGKFVDGFETQQGATILLDFEGDRADTASRQVAVIDTYKDITGREDIPFLVGFMPSFVGSSDDMPEQIYNTITSLPAPYNKPAFIVLDTYGAFAHLKDEDDNAEVQRFWDRVKLLKKLFAEAGMNTAFMLTAHTRKLNDKSIGNISLDDIRGASASGGAISEAYYLEKVKGDPDIKQFKELKAKGKQENTEIKRLQMFYENNEDGTFRRMHFGMIDGTDAKTLQKEKRSRKQASDNKKKTAIIDFVKAHAGCSVSRICRTQYEDRLQMGITTVQTLVDELIAEGKIINTGEDDKYCLTVIG